MARQYLRIIVKRIKKKKKTIRIKTIKDRNAKQFQPLCFSLRFVSTIESNSDGNETRGENPAPAQRVLIRSMKNF